MFNRWRSYRILGAAFLLASLLANLSHAPPAIRADKPDQATELDAPVTTADQATILWTTKAPMPTPRLDLGLATAADGKLYAIAGWAGSNLGSINAVEAYDPATDTWSTRSPAPTARYGLAVAAATDGKLYAVGGVNGDCLNTVEEYNPVANTWAARAPMAIKRAGMAVVAGANGRIYAIGGYGCPGRLSSVEEYDPSLDTWTTKAPMPAARSGHVAVATADGLIYAIGGASGSDCCYSVTNSVYVYNPASDIWTSAASMPIARMDFAVAAANGKIYAIGGGSPGSQVDEYDPAVNSWTTTTSLPDARARESAATGINGKLYVVGGCAACDLVVSTVFEGTIGPESHVATLPTYTASSSFTVSWSGTAASNPIASYDVQYKDGASGTWTDWLTGTIATSATFGPSSPVAVTEGHTYYFQSRARDSGGNVESYPGGNGDAYTTVDLTPPTGTLQAQGWSSPYISDTVSLSVWATDGTSGVGQMQFGPDGQTWNPWESFATTSAYQAPAGATAVYGRFKDNAGNVSQPVSAAVSLDTEPPTGNLSINGGASYANTITATVALSATDNLSGVSGMSFSNDGSTWSDWQGYSNGKSWSLVAGPDGPRTAYARFQDVAGNVSQVYSDTIILDTTPPTGALAINDGAVDSNSTAVTLTLAAQDNLSGVAQMSFSNDGQSYSPWEGYSSTRSWNLTGGNGVKTVYARFRDNAGDSSTPASGTITLNSVLPTSAVTALTPYQSTAYFAVTWSGTALGHGLAGFDIQYKDGSSGQWTDWLTNTLSTTAVFTGTEGHIYFFQSRAHDQAGNVEAYVGGDGQTHTTVDLTAPSGTISVNGGALDTTAVAVTLSLSATDSLSGAYQSAFSNDGSSWSPWESFAAARPWTLSIGDGDKAVWARFKDNAGNVSDPVSDTIRLDTSMSPAYGLSIDEDALFTNQVTVTLDLPANPGTARVMVSNGGGFYAGTWEPYAAYKSWQITQYGSYVIPRTVYVKYKDVNGNVSSVYQDDIILDLNPPTGSVSIEGAGTSGAKVGADASSVTLQLSANDDVSGIAGMMVSNSPAFGGSSWESFSATKSWTMDSGGKVYVAFKDNAGNASPTYDASLSGNKGTLPSVVLGTVRPNTGGVLISSDAGMQVSFPPGAVGAKADVTLVPEIDSSLTSDTGALKSAGKFLTLTAREGTTVISSFSKAYTMTVSYSVSDITGIDEDSLAIYTWNGTVWQKEAGSRANKLARTVSAAIDHLSSFALLGESTSRTIYLPVVTRSAMGW